MINETSNLKLFQKSSHLAVSIREFLNQAEREPIETETETDNIDAEKTFSK